MTNEIRNNAMVLDAENVIDDSLLDKVSGGDFGITSAIIFAVTTLAASADNGAKELRHLVNSYEYRKMSNADKEKAIGGILANNIAFNVAVKAGAGLFGGVAVTAMQVKYRTVGVCGKVREAVEHCFKS